MQAPPASAASGPESTASRPESAVAEPASVNAKQQNAPPGLGGFVSQSCALDGACRAHEAPPETHIPPAEEQEEPVEEHDEDPYAASSAPSARSRSAPSGSRRTNVGSAFLRQDTRSSVLRGNMLRATLSCWLPFMTCKACQSTTCARAATASLRRKAACAPGVPVARCAAAIAASYASAFTGAGRRRGGYPRDSRAVFVPKRATP